MLAALALLDAPQLNVGVRQRQTVVDGNLMAHPVTRYRSIVVAVAALSGCGHTDRPEAQDLALLPRTEVSPPHEVPVSSDSGAGCISQQGQQVVVRGMARREVRTGPPGYGETPTLDKRDTILVMRLPKRVRVCTDRSLDPSGPAVIETDSVQLVGRLDPRSQPSGDTLTVFGTFRQQTWGWHYTRVVLEVDSVAPHNTVRPRSG